MAVRQVWNEEMELMPDDKIRALQWEKLKKMLDYVYNRSQFYRKKFDRAGIKPQDIKSLEDFATKVPVTTKEELRETQAQGYPFGTNLCCDYEDVVMITASTGTTGKPTYTGVTRKDYEMWCECIKRTMWFGGLRPSDVYLHGLALSTWISGIAVVNSARQLGATVVPVGVPIAAERLLMLAGDTKANTIACTPSYAEHLAEKVRQLLNKDPREIGFQKMWCGGEPGAGIPAVKKRIEKLWGCDLRDLMGTPEMIPADWIECRYKRGMHFVARDYCLNEFVDPETKAPLELKDGMEGSLVYTSLEKECAPLIRFEVGDRIKVFTEPCECGYPGIRINVIGRTDDMLKVKGVKTWPSAVKDVLSQMTPELSGVFRIILSEKPEAFAVRGPVKLRVEYIPQLKPEELPQLKKRIVEAIRTALVWSPDEVELVPEGTIPRVEMKSRYIEIEDGAK